MQEFQFSEFFPFKEPREEQIASIKFSLDAFLNKRKKFVVLELGTGVGKSAIGITIANYFSANVHEDRSNAYFLTTQKLLQEQYVKDFSHPNGCMKSIKSASNYDCRYLGTMSCAEALRIANTENKGSPLWTNCMMNCHYKQEKLKFIDGMQGVTNYSYFLAETQYAKKLKKRQLLVLDEAHGLENELSKFIEVTISEKFTKEALKLTYPEHDNQQKIVDWIKTEYEPAVVEKLTKLTQGIAKFRLESKMSELQTIARQHDMLEKHAAKMKKFLSIWSDDNWSLNVIAGDGKRTMRKLEFKPVDVAPYAHDLLFNYCDYVLMLSATIVNKDVFCQSLGIRDTDVEFLSIDSPFPIENRPIYYVPIGNMTKSEIDASLPKLVELVKEIIKQHKDEKGIIHTHTFAIANYIKKHIKNKRLLVHDSTNREIIIDQHISSKEPTILLSPSLSEGIDLKDDLSRFQLICKIPFPYLGDKLVKKRMNKNKHWYAFQTAKTIIQSVGRSIRNKDDHAVTYILDGSWQKFYDTNKNMFPESFKKALKM